MICKTPVSSHRWPLPRVQTTVCRDKGVGVLMTCLVAHFVPRELLLDGIGYLFPAPMGILTSSLIHDLQDTGLFPSLATA
jgi:hypothetical protein